MTDEELRAALETAYQSTRTELMAILYEEDPAGFGSSVSAPKDEYSEEAARLMARLRGAQTRADVSEVITTMFEHPSDQLVRKVHGTWIEHGGPTW